MRIARPLRRAGSSRASRPRSRCSSCSKPHSRAGAPPRWSSSRSPPRILGGALAAAAAGGVSLGSICRLPHRARHHGPQRDPPDQRRPTPRAIRRADGAGRRSCMPRRERLLPLLTTVIATIAAFVPFLVLGDRPGYELIRPMAIVLVGGLVTATAPRALRCPDPVPACRVAPHGRGRAGARHATPRSSNRPRPRSGVMPRTDRWILVFVTSLTLLVGACAQSAEPEAASDEGLARLEAIAGSDVKRITAERASRRTDRHPDGACRGRRAGGRIKVPSATLLYDQTAGPGSSRSPSTTSSSARKSRSIGTNGEDTILSTGPTAEHARRDGRCRRAVRHRARRRRPGVSGQRRLTMLRRIVASSLRFRFIVVAIAARDDALRRAGAAARRRSTSSRSSPRRASRSRPPPSGLSAADVESFVTVPLEQALAGVQGLDILRSKSVAAAVADRADLQARHRPAACRASSSRSASRRVTPSLPTWAAPPFMMPPVSATSRVMKIGMSSKTMSVDGHVDDRLLDDPGAAAAASRRVANVPIWGERLNQLHVQVDPGEDGAARRHARPGDGGAPPTRSTPGSSTFSEAPCIGTGGFVDTAEPALRIRHVPPIVDARRAAQGRARSNAERQAGPSERCRRRRRGPPAAVRRRRHQRRARPAAHRREVPVGEHAGRHARRRGGARGAEAGPARHRRRHHDLPPGRRSSRPRSTT